MDSSSWSKYGTIDPALEALLPHLPPGKSFADYDSAAELRTSITDQVNQMIAAGIAKPVDWQGVEKSEVQIPTRDDSSVRAVVYRPQSAQPGPLCVYFHGGGWTFGWPESGEAGIEVLTKQCGITVVAVAYRLAPEHVFPTAAHDACDALKWCAENADSLGADVFKGLLVAGTSAGGNLAAVAAHDAVESMPDRRVTGVVLMCASLVQNKALPEKYREHYNSREEQRDAMILDARGMDWFLEQYKADVHSPLASPLIWPGGHEKQPATYLQATGMDPLRDDSLIYEHILREDYGVPTKLDMYAGYPHAAPDFFPMLPVAGKALVDLKAGVEWILSQRAG